MAGGRDAAGGGGGSDAEGASSSQASAGALPVPAGRTEEAPPTTGRGAVGIAGFANVDVVTGFGAEGADDEMFLGGGWALRMAMMSGRPTGV